MKPAPLRAFFFLPNDRVGIWAGDPTRIAASLYWRGDPKPAARGSRIAARVAGDGWKSNGKLPRVADHGAGIVGGGDRRRRRVEVKRETSKPTAGNVHGKTNRRNFSAVRGSRIADRSRFDSRCQSWIGDSGSDRGGSRPDRQTFNRFSQSWIADRGSRYVSTGGREAGRGMFHFLKDTKNPALGGVH